MNCRHCAGPLLYTFLDLGFAPPSNSYLSAQDLTTSEKYYPLRIKVCDKCWLVQTEDYARAEDLFGTDYAYFSSISSSWVSHARTYCKLMIQSLMLGPESYVIEVASNDGYLLRNFLEAGIPCLGIEPTTSTARAAEAIGIPTLQEFFSETLARQLSVSGRKADLIVVNNVYAHVPDINGFTKGLSLLLKPEGVVTLEFPHLLELIRQTQFDTVYHEHFSYLSLSVVQKIFSEAGLRVWDVERLSTHGGSLRVFGCHKNSVKLSSKRVIEVLEQERSDALNGLATYTNFQAQADRIKDNFLAFLIEQKRAGKSVAGYGAAAKANTLLNYAGIKPDLLPYVCDAALSKQGRFLPGSHIPIYSPRRLEDSPPDIVLVFPWNLRDELSAVLAPVVAAGSEIYVAVPQLERIA